ncbi:hypothetical protein M413DRAFT_141207 [Hebeloma cylindrosporum]|uniref:Uncharacterized protein n=1 Tax=Hebeloma cylindrosporum TaxID=76867 RepID=A0A0C3CE87_HEBCY|nr:hypothetical protein M413DRAFT_141207 [Hebeloma cylindrosporum h7]
MRLSLRIIRKSLNIAFSALNVTSSQFLHRAKQPSSSSTRSNPNVPTDFHHTMGVHKATRPFTAPASRTNTPQTPQSSAVTPAAKSSSIQTEMSARRTEHQPSSLAATTTDSQSDHSNVAQLSIMTPGIPNPLAPDAHAPPGGVSGTTRNATDVVMGQAANPHKMDLAISKGADARLSFKKKKKAPVSDDEDEELKQLIKDFKKAPSKKKEDDDSSLSFLTHDNKIAQQPSLRKLADASSRSAVEPTLEEIDAEAFDKEIDMELCERRRLLSTSSRRPGSDRGKMNAVKRRMPPSSASVGSVSQPQIGIEGGNTAKSLSAPFTFASSTPPLSQNVNPVSYGRAFTFDTKLANSTAGSSQPQRSDSTQPQTGASMTPSFLGVSSAPKAPRLHSSYIPPNAPTTQGMMPRQIESLLKRSVGVTQPTGQNTPRRPNREGSVQRKARPPSDPVSRIHNPPVRSRLGGNVIIAPAPPPQHMTEDVAMGSVSNFSTTVVEEIAPNISSTPSSASPVIAVQSSDQRPASSNLPESSLPLHAGDVAMHVVATIGNTEEGTSSSINPIPLPGAPLEDKEPSSTPVTLTVVDDWDDMYGEEAVYTDEEKGLANFNETITKPSPPGSTTNFDTNASTSIMDVKEVAVASSDTDVRYDKASNTDGPVLASSPPADRNSEVKAEPQAKVSIESQVPSYSQNPSPSFDQASAQGQVVSPTPSSMSMETNAVLFTNAVEIAEVSVEAVAFKNGSRTTEVGLLGGGGQAQGALPPNPLELFASVATSPNVDATLTQFREEKSRRQGKEGRDEVMSSRVEELEQELQRMDVSVAGFNQSSEQLAKSTPMDTLASAPATNVEFTLSQSEEESMDFRKSESSGQPTQQMSLSEEASSRSMDVGQATEISDSSRPPLIPRSSSQPPLPAIQTDDIDMSAEERRIDSSTSVPNPSPIISGNHAPPVVETVPAVLDSSTSNAPPPPTTSKAPTAPGPLKPSAEPAVPPSSKQDKAKKAAIATPSSKMPVNLKENPGNSTKSASKIPKEDLPDVPKSPKAKSSEKSKAKSKDSNTMKPPAVPRKRPEDAASITAKSTNSGKLEDRRPNSNPAKSQKPKADPSVNTVNSTHVQKSSPVGEHTERLKPKGKEKEKELGECSSDDEPNEAANSPRSSSKTDSASTKEPTVVAKPSSPSPPPSPHFMPAAYSFAKKDLSVEDTEINGDDPIIDVAYCRMEVDMDAGGNDCYNDVEMHECPEHCEEMEVDPVSVNVSTFPPSHPYETYGTSHDLSSSTTSVPPSFNNQPLYPPAGRSSSENCQPQASSVHLTGNSPSGFSTAWNSYEPEFHRSQHCYFPQAQEPFVADSPSMVHHPGPNPVEYVYNAQSPSPCLANNVGVIGFSGPALYDTGFQPGPPCELSRDSYARHQEPLDKPSLESLLLWNYQRKPQWEPFSERIPEYVEPVEPVSYGNPDPLDTPPLDVLLRGDWKPLVTLFSSPATEVVEPIPEPSSETVVTGEACPLEERVPAWKDTPETCDARVAETTPEAPDEDHRCSRLEPPSSDLGTATEATAPPPVKPSSTFCKRRERTDYGARERGDPYPMHRTALAKAIFIAEGTGRKEPLETTALLETTQPSKTRSYPKTTSEPTPKPKAKRRRMPGTWRGPLTPRTAGEERFYRVLSSVLRHIRQRVRKAFGEVDNTMNRPSSKHRLHTRVST